MSRAQLGGYLMKVGLLGGTFDPIHYGHLNLAFEMLEKVSLDEIWMCPTWTNPHKVIGQASSAADRLEMVRLAIEDIPQFKVIDNEVRRGGVSYTVETLRELRAEHPQIKFFLILGEDAATNFFKWKDPQEILSLCDVLVGSRTAAKAGVPDSLKKGYIATRLLDISATEVRSRVNKSLYISHLVPGKVVDFISRNQLY